jgi:hypothetical protein
VPLWSGSNTRTQEVFRRGFLPAQLPDLSSLAPSPGQAAKSTMSRMSDSDLACVAAQGYALGVDAASAVTSGTVQQTPAAESSTVALSSQSQADKSAPAPAAGSAMSECVTRLLPHCSQSDDLDSQPQENKSTNAPASTLPPSTGLDMPASSCPPLPDPPAQIAPVGQSPGAASACCPRRGLAEEGTPAEESSPCKKLRTAGAPPSGNSSRPKHRPLRRSKRSCVLRKAEYCASQENMRTDLEGCPNSPNQPAVRGALTWEQMIASSRQPSLARDQSDKRQDNEMHDDQMQDLASTEQHTEVERDAKASQKDSRANNSDNGPSLSCGIRADAGRSASLFPSTSTLLPRTPAQPLVPASQTRSRSPARMLETLDTVLHHVPQGVPQPDNNPFSSGRFSEAFHASLQPPPLPHGFPSGLSSSRSSMSALLRNAAHVQLTSSFIPPSAMPPANPPPATGPRDASSSAAAAGHSAGGLPSSGRERSRSPRAFRLLRKLNARYGMQILIVMLHTLVNALADQTVS